MNRLQVAALVTRLVERLRNHGSWCGETHVQKAMFVTQELARVPMGFEFILYKHGPFSFELRDELTSLRADGLLRLEPQPFPYGPKFTVTDLANALQDRFPKTIKKYETELDFVAARFAGMGVGELEQVATAIFASTRLGSEDVQQRAQWVHENKPHISFDKAVEALKNVDRIVAQFQRN